MIFNNFYQLNILKVLKYVTGQILKNKVWMNIKIWYGIKSSEIRTLYMFEQ